MPAVRISVVIANHNYGHLLPELFGSLAAQAIDPALVEAVFADDASTDDSLKTARKLGSALPFARFAARSFPRMGHPALTRNAGFALSTGDAILFLDADDLIEPEFLPRCLDALSSGADVAYTDYMEQTPGGERAVSLPDFDPDILRTQNIPTMGALVRREVVSSLGGFKDNTAYEDWDFWVRAAHAGYRFAHVAAPVVHAPGSSAHDAPPLYRYRHHGVNFSVKARANDGPAKAAIVLNTPGFFHPEVVRWARGVAAGKPWAQPCGRGLIPREEDVRKLREMWADVRKRARG
jgi:glycosyltransferase involved in cell wall biosynthesis